MALSDADGLALVREMVRKNLTPEQVAEWEARVAARMAAYEARPRSLMRKLVEEFPGARIEVEITGKVPGRW